MACISVKDGGALHRIGYLFSPPYEVVLRGDTKTNKRVYKCKTKKEVIKVVSRLLDNYFKDYGRVKTWEKRVL